MRNIGLAISGCFEAVFLVMLVICLLDKGGYEYWSVFFCMLLMTVPALLRHFQGVNLPWPVVLVAGTALFLHAWGLTSGYYGLHWWDKLTHLTSGIAVASLVALVLLVMVHHTDTIRIPPRWFPFLLLVSVLAFEGSWEMLEYSVDIFRGTDMQHGIEDTVNDILTNAVSGIVAGIGAAYFIGRSSIHQIVEGMNVGNAVESLKKYVDR